ncbi:MAG: hypothetical protein U1E65_05280 [Myxococcota bacterium]
MSEQNQVRSENAGKDGQKTNGTPRNASADELLEAMANEAAEPKEQRSSLGRAMRDVVIVAALLSGGTYVYYNHITTKEKTTKLAQEASDKLEKDDLKSLKEAQSIYEEILKLDGDNAIGLSGLAETYFQEWRHGLDTKAKAEEYLNKAVKEGADTPERYATAAYLDIAAGRAQKAETDIKTLLDKGAYHSKLAHAYGWALMEQGKFIDANRAVRGALDTDFNAVRYPFTLAEIAWRQGGPRNSGDKEALKNIMKVLSNGMNENHELALTEAAALRAKNYGNIDKPAKWIQNVEARQADVGPVAVAQLDWASGELALSLTDAKVALEKAEAAIGKRKDFPPFYDLKARALLAQGKTQDAYAAYEEGMKVGPGWRGLKWAYAELRSAQNDDAALAMIDELEKSDTTPQKGAEYEIFRGNHYLRMNKVDEAKAAFTRAAELGDDAEILFGLARVTFLEEKKKAGKADLEKVATDFETANTAKSTFPELQEYMAGVSLWNFQVDGAEGSFEEAEKQYKKLNRPVPELLAFYDRVVTAYEKAEGAAKAEAAKKVQGWKDKKKEYLASVAALLSGS